MSVTKDEVSDLIRANNNQLMASFKELLKDTAGQIKRANETSTEQQMKEIKKLKFQEPHKFKRKANEDQFKFNLKLAETFDSAKSAAEKSNLEKVKSDLEEGRFRLQVPNHNLCPSSQPRPIPVSRLVVLTLAHASLVERPAIGVPAAPR